MLVRPVSAFLHYNWIHEICYMYYNIGTQHLLVCNTNYIGYKLLSYLWNTRELVSKISKSIEDLYNHGSELGRLNSALPKKSAYLANY